MKPSLETTSTQPYLVRAWHEWCTDNGLTPYISVAVDRSVQVPREYVKDDEIVLNISYDACTALKLGNDYVEFKARFGGVARDVIVPVDHILAIFARENGQGMAFPNISVAETESSDASMLPAADRGAAPQASPAARAPHLAPVSDPGAGESAAPAPEAADKPVARPTLTRIK